MNLRSPHETLAGCCWLPRLADKVRASEGSHFPLLYRLSLGSPVGIDGFFLRHFKIPFSQLRQAVLDTQTDEDLSHWFLAQPTVNVGSITKWNHYGPKLGSPGYPGSVFKHLIKWFVYPKSVKHPVDSFFDMIEQDEE